MGMRRCIVIFSMEPWGDMWYSKHHYAAQLAKSHDVYFVSLPDRWRWTDLFSSRATVSRVPEGVHVVEYRNNLPLRFLGRWLKDRVLAVSARRVKAVLPASPWVLWAFYPSELASQLARAQAGNRLIYHVVDPFHDRSNDLAVGRQADLVVAINPWYRRFYSRLNDHCIEVPHGVQRAHREQEEAAVEAYRSRWGRFALLASGLSGSVNYRLLLRLAKERPGVPLLIAGKHFPLRADAQALSDALFAQPNVHDLGVLPPNELRNLVRAAAVCLLTYDFEPRLAEPTSAGRTPLKVLTYLAQHRPVVSTNNSYVPALEGKGFFKADTPEEFMRLVCEVLDGARTVDTAAVDRYLDSVDYARLSERILDALDDATSARPAAPRGKPRIPAGHPVMIISNEAWEGPLYSKHRTALALAPKRVVLFLDPAERWRPINLLRWRIAERHALLGVTVLTYFNPLPFFGGWLRGLNDALVQRRLRRFLERSGRQHPMVWSFDPSRLVRPQRLEPVASIYHCADDHRFGVNEEGTLARNVDHVFCIARQFMPRFRTMNASVHHVPHGLAPEDLAPPALPSRFGEGYGLYIGNVNDRHDFALWRKLMVAHPDVRWVVVGPVRVKDPVGLDLIEGHPLPNVTFVGPVPYPELRVLIAHCGFGFLYMKPDSEANRISSQKVVQFLAQGKPFFSSWLSEYEGHPELITLSDSHDQALERFAHWRTHGEPAHYKAARLAHARSLLYDQLMERLPFTL